MPEGRYLQRILLRAGSLKKAEGESCHGGSCALDRGSGCPQRLGAAVGARGQPASHRDFAFTAVIPGSSPTSAGFHGPALH